MKNLKSYNYFINESQDTEVTTDASKAFELAGDIMEIISAEEAKVLSDFYKQNGKEKFSQILSQVKESEMSDSEKKVRNVIDKIIKGMRFIGGATPVGIVTGNWPLAIGLGISAIAGEVLKDAAWWKLKGGYYEAERDESRREH